MITRVDWESHSLDKVAFAQAFSRLNATEQQAINDALELQSRLGSTLQFSELRKALGEQQWLAFSNAMDKLQHILAP